MATPAATVLPTRAMEVIVKGKLVSSRRHENRYFTQIITPAVDEFSQPQHVEVRSKAKVGDRDEMVTVRARLGGYLGRPYQATDKSTGEMRTARNTVLTLDVVE